MSDNPSETAADLSPTRVVYQLGPVEIIANEDGVHLRVERTLEQSEALAAIDAYQTVLARHATGVHPTPRPPARVSWPLYDANGIARRAAKVAHRAIEEEFGISSDVVPF